MFLFIVGVVLVAYVLDKAIRSLKVDGFAQKYVFITGCDSGFGQRLAIRLDGLGFPVFAACLTKEGQTFLSENASTRLTSLPLDVTDSASIQQALEFVQSKLPNDTGLWAIVNNAGIGGPMGPTEMCSMEGFRKCLEVNLFGPVEICRKFLPLVRRVKGRVVNIASVMGRNAAVTSPYNTSKFGMEGFSDSLRREVYHQGVKVSILEPGFFKTNIITRDNLVNSVKQLYKQASQEVRTAYGENFVEENITLVDDIQTKANPNIDWVVDAFIHAIVSRYPRTRYVVGWDAWLFFIPLSWLPGGVADWIIMSLKAKTIQAGLKKTK